MRPLAALHWDSARTAGARGTFHASSTARTVNTLSTLNSPMRSEEHTSELQSQSNLVCRLLLEKKKKKKNTRLHCNQQTQVLTSAMRRQSALHAATLMSH